MHLKNIHRLFNGGITIEGMNLYDIKSIINLLTLTDPSPHHRKCLCFNYGRDHRKRKK